MAGEVVASGWLRRARAAAMLGLAWGVAWFSAGMVLLLIVGPDAADVPFPLGFGVLGFFAGVTFAGLLTIAERRRTFDQISIPRFASWGAAAGLLFAVLFVLAVALAGGGLLPLGVLGPVFAAAGAGCAGGSLALARSAGDDRRPALSRGSRPR